VITKKTDKQKRSDYKHKYRIGLYTEATHFLRKRRK